MKKRKEKKRKEKKRKEKKRKEKKRKEKKRKEKKRKEKKRKEKKRKGKERKGKERKGKEKKEKKRKERKEKTERNFPNTWTGGAHPIIPMSTWQKIPKSNTSNDHTIFKIWDEQWVIGALCILYPALMSCKISQLKFRAYKFEKMQRSSIKPFENYSRSRAPISHIRSSGGPIFPTVSNLPIASSKRPPNVPLRHQGPNFLFSLSGHLGPRRFPNALFRVSILAIVSSKCLKFSIAPSRAPISSSCLQNDHL